MQNKLTIQVWSDIQCPWCWVGKRRLERALASVTFGQHVEVVHRAFRLMPNIPVQSVEQVFAGKHGRAVDTTSSFARMEEIAAAEGLTYHLAGALAGDTLDAHRLVAYAKPMGLQDKVLEGLYKAHFTDGLSIFAQETLVKIAATAGLDPMSVGSMLASHNFVHDVETDEQTARALGIRGVPYFLMGDQLSLSGGQLVEAFVTALHQAWNSTNILATQHPHATRCGSGDCTNIGTVTARS